MKKDDVKQAVFEVIGEYGKALKNSAQRTFLISESSLPYSKKVIKNAIRVALLMTDDEDMIEQLKSSYISLANFVPEEEVKKTKDISQDLFAFLEMDEDKKREFLRDRIKSGLLGDYERATRITTKIAEEQKRLREEIDEFLKIGDNG
jgi:predicted RNA-binding protein with EMAP domain